MKLRILAAASAVVIGGVAFAVYRETRPDTAAAAASSPTPAERAAPSSSVPVTDEPSATVPAGTASSPTSGARTAAPSAPALPASASAAELGSRPGSSNSRTQEPASGIITTRIGVKSLKPAAPRRTEVLEPGSPEAAIERQKRMNRTLESAACHAPDIEKRYSQLSENERAALRARCAKYGVTLGNPS